MQNEIVKLEIKENNWLVATYAAGNNSVIGDVKTAKGGKMMLTRRAKQFGLRVISETTAIR